MASLKGLYFPFEIVQGESFSVSIDISVDDEQQYYTDYNFSSAIKESSDQPNQISSFTFVENADDSDLVDITLDAAETATIPAGGYIYEIKVSPKESSEVKTIMYGTFNVKPTLIQSQTNQYPAGLVFDR